MGHFLYRIILLIFLVSCGGILVKQQYSNSFLEEIKKAKKYYNVGDSNSAFGVMQSIKDEGLSLAESTMKYNMIGFLHFSLKHYEKSIENFKKALSFQTPDREMQAQVNLNLASSYFKLNEYKEAFFYATNTDYNSLSEKEFKIHIKLYYILSKEVNEPYHVAKATILLSKDAKVFEDVRSGQYSSVMEENYFQLTKSERVRLLEEFEGKNNLAIAYLGIQEGKKLYFTADKSTAKDVLSWTKREFANNPDIVSIVDSILDRMQSFAKMIPNHIGVVLPLSGPRENFGNKALFGIDTALSESEGSINKLFVKDNKDSKIVSTLAVRELVENHFVSFIIGGLFPDTAKEEYLEAKKYGVIFISLSPIYLPKEEKNHLLIEIPGSIESQISSLFSDGFLEKMGKKIAVMYPNNDGGEAYVDEVWRLAKSKNVTITSVISYDKELTDFRDPISKLLGLFYTREREEEHNLWEDVFSLTKTKVRRIQTLPPVVDFDWVLVPSFPKEAIQIIPSFSYFDAKGLKYVGGPSWRSQKILDNYKNMGKLFFVGEDLEKNKLFYQRYVERYKKKPKIIEAMAYDSAKLGIGLINKEFSTREELETSLIQKTYRKAAFGEWNLVDGIWIKKMDTLTFAGGKIVDANIPPVASEQAPVN